MNKYSKYAFFVVCIAFFSLQTYAFDVTVGNYRLNIDESTGKVNIYKGSMLLIRDSQLSFKVNSTFYSAGSGTVSQSDFSDALGNGKKVVYTSTVNDWTVEQTFYLYPSANYLATDFTVETAIGTVSSNYMAPVKTSSEVIFLPSGDNRVLRVPFDNDDFIRFESNSFRVGNNTSYEVTALYSEGSRRGLIVGSIEHDTWKTGVATNTMTNIVYSMEIYGGIATSLTRDHIPHGSVNMKKIKSPKIFIGYYDDWRDGLEDYGKVNRLLAPKYYDWAGSWNGKKPFGWNSWAALASRVNFNNADQSSAWVADNIQSSFKSEDNTVYIGLDSYWNESGFNNATLKQFVDNCHSRGQKAGVYLVPFSHWGRNAPSFALLAGGKPRQLDGGWCIDPTHPDTKNRVVNEFLIRIKQAGFDYIKMDFMGHGAMEADSWYDPEIQTGIQAYNHGMKWLADWFRDNMPNMFVNLSIAPLFPGQYAHSRRISCDAWEQMYNANIRAGTTEYVLNSLTYGWWLDYVYDFNDADHIKLDGVGEGENRARITSSAITGIFILGDNYSESGDNEMKERSKLLLKNSGIIQMAHNTKAFRPVRSGNGNRASEMFYQKSIDGDVTYVAIFNYGTASRNYTIDFSDLDCQGTFNIFELWSEKEVAKNVSLWSGAVNGRDCIVLKIFEVK